jgi:predicted alpha-1,6-mannanase (GH76 family)
VVQDVAYTQATIMTLIQLTAVYWGPHMRMDSELQSWHFWWLPEHLTNMVPGVPKALKTM